MFSPGFEPGHPGLVTKALSFALPVPGEILARDYYL